MHHTTAKEDGSTSSPRQYIKSRKIDAMSVLFKGLFPHKLEIHSNRALLHQGHVDYYGVISDLKLLLKVECWSTPTIRSAPYLSNMKHS